MLVTSVEAAFVALAEHLEEQFGAGLGQRHEAQFIDDEQFVAGDLLLEAEQLLLVAGLDQLADQGGGGGEAHAMAALAGSQAESQGDVRLARATRYRNIMPIVRRRSRLLPVASATWSGPKRAKACAVAAW